MSTPSRRSASASTASAAFTSAAAAAAPSSDSHVRYLRDRLSAKLGSGEEEKVKGEARRRSKTSASASASSSKSKTTRAPKTRSKDPLRLSPPLAAPTAVRRVLRTSATLGGEDKDRAVKVTVNISSRGKPKASSSSNLRDAVLTEARRPGSRTAKRTSEPITIFKSPARRPAPPPPEDPALARRSRRSSSPRSSPRVASRTTTGHVSLVDTPVRSRACPRPPAEPARPEGYTSLVASSPRARPVARPVSRPCRSSPPPDQIRVWPGSGPPGSSHFFEHLFCRDMSPCFSQSGSRSLSVAERARVFCGDAPTPPRRPSFRSEPALDVYLQQRKPVTESRFRSLDRLSRVSRSTSLPPLRRAVCPDRAHDFMSMVQRFESEECVSVSVSRSASEPPQAQQAPQAPAPPPLPPAPAEVAGSRSSTLSRSPSHRRIQGARCSRRCVEGVEGVRAVGRSAGRARSVGDPDPRAEHQDYQAYVLELVHSSKKSERFRELNEFYSKLERKGLLERTASTGDLRPRMRSEEIIDYDRWRSVRAKERAEEELQVLYHRLREDQRSKDLLFATKDVDAVRWKGDRGLRVKDRSVEDLRAHFRRLGSEDRGRGRRDADCQDVYKPLWRGNSVANLANSLKRTTASHRGRPVAAHAEFASRSLDRKHTRLEVGAIGNRLWSSLSLEQVNALKSQLNEIYSTCPARRTGQGDDTLSPRPSLHVRSNSLVSSEDLYTEILLRRERRRAEGLKADSISSLAAWRDDPEADAQPRQSRTTLAQSLSEAEKKRLSRTLGQEAMTRRRTRSVMSPRETLGATAAADAKVASRWTPSSPRTCYSLDHSAQEDLLIVLDDDDAPRRDSAPAPPPPPPPLPPQQAPPRSRRQPEEARPVSASETESASSTASTRTVIRVEAARAPPCEQQHHHQTATVATATASQRVQSRVDFFESIESTGPPSLTPAPISASAAAVPSTSTALESSRAGSGEQTAAIDRRPVAPASSAASSPGGTSAGLLSSPHSQSHADLRELFGESCTARHYVTSASIAAAPAPPAAAVRRHRPRSASLESMLSPAASPDPTKYYRAYIRMVKGGDVRRLADRFESLDDLTYMCVRDGGAAPEAKQARMARACRSDPDLARRVVVRGHEAGDVDWLRRRYEGVRAKRAASRTGSSPVPKKPLEDRFMPHINVISKTASLQRRTTTSSTTGKTSSSRTTTTCRSTASSKHESEHVHTGHVHTGHVDRLRHKFESELSLLGQMFTSTPDVHELRDIAPFLGCRWVAHQYPEPDASGTMSPLSRSMSALDVERSRSPGRLPTRPRPASASPTRRQPASILKHARRQLVHVPITYDRFANQPFDPTIHRPVRRYQPPPPPQPPLPPPQPRRPWTALDCFWSSRHRPTVHFKDLEPELDFMQTLAPLPKAYESEPESPHRYTDSEVTIRYRSPVSALDGGRPISEQELRGRQAEAMRRLYQEERRRKYLHELQDINSRRHTDNFTPSQKSPIPLNRYDDLLDEYWTSGRSGTPVSRLAAKALYNFVGQTPRELSFRRGDVIQVRRQVDRNWYEGELNGLAGLFPANYVEVLPYEHLRTTPTKRVQEGQARAKYNFIAQTRLELSLAKGELVNLIRRVDENWFEGRVGNQKGIFPVTYVEVLLEPSERPATTPIPTGKPVAAPAAHSLIINGGSSGPASMAQHSYQPPTSRSPANYSGVTPYGSVAPSAIAPAHHQGKQAASHQQHLPAMSQTLHIDTHSDPVPYRALYNYRPQNDDELELVEGDVVLVMEKCDDGWYVGSSQRTGFFGTFPGNYVERI